MLEVAYMKAALETRLGAIVAFLFNAAAFLFGVWSSLAQNTLPIGVHHILIDARDSRAGNGDVAAGYLFAIDLIETYGINSDQITIVVAPPRADGRSASAGILKNLLGKRWQGHAFQWNGKNIRVALAARDGVLTCPQCPAFDWVVSLAKPSGTPSTLKVQPETVFKPTTVFTNQTVLGNTENRNSSNPLGSIQYRALTMATQAAGLASNEAGIHRDVVAQHLRTLSHEQRRQFLFDEIQQIHQTLTASALRSIFADRASLSAQQAKRKTAVLYGVSSRDVSNDFSDYLNGLLAEHQRSGQTFLLVTPSHVRDEVLSGLPSSSVRVIALDSDTDSTPTNTSAESTLNGLSSSEAPIVIVKTPTLPHSVFVSLMALSEIPYIVAGDGAMSAAIILGLPFLMTTVKWNEANARQVAGLLSNAGDAPQLQELIGGAFNATPHPPDQRPFLRALDLMPLANRYLELGEKVRFLPDTMVTNLAMALAQEVAHPDPEHQLDRSILRALTSGNSHPHDVHALLEWLRQMREQHYPTLPAQNKATPLSLLDARLRRLDLARAGAPSLTPGQQETLASELFEVTKHFLFHPRGTPPNASGEPGRLVKLLKQFNIRHRIPDSTIENFTLQLLHSTIDGHTELALAFIRDFKLHSDALEDALVRAIAGEFGHTEGQRAYLVNDAVYTAKQYWHWSEQRCVAWLVALAIQPSTRAPALNYLLSDSIQAPQLIPTLSGAYQLSKSIPTLEYLIFLETRGHDAFIRGGLKSLEATLLRHVRNTPEHIDSVMTFVSKYKLAMGSSFWSNLTTQLIATLTSSYDPNREYSIFSIVHFLTTNEPTNLAFIPPSTRQQLLKALITRLRLFGEAPDGNQRLLNLGHHTDALMQALTVLLRSMEPGPWPISGISDADMKVLVINFFKPGNNYIDRRHPTLALFAQKVLSREGSYLASETGGREVLQLILNRIEGDRKETQYYPGSMTHLDPTTLMAFLLNGVWPSLKAEMIRLVRRNGNDPWRHDMVEGINDMEVMNECIEALSTPSST